MEIFLRELCVSLPLFCIQIRKCEDAQTAVEAQSSHIWTEEGTNAATSLLTLSGISWSAEELVIPSGSLQGGKAYVLRVDVWAGAGTYPPDDSLRHVGFFTFTAS